MTDPCSLPEDATTSPIGPLQTAINQARRHLDNLQARPPYEVYPFELNEARQAVRQAEQHLALARRQHWQQVFRYLRETSPNLDALWTAARLGACQLVAKASYQGPNSETEARIRQELEERWPFIDGKETAPVLEGPPRSARGVHWV